AACSPLPAAAFAPPPHAAATSATALAATTNVHLRMALFITMLLPCIYRGASGSAGRRTGAAGPPVSGSNDPRRPNRIARGSSHVRPLFHRVADRGRPGRAGPAAVSPRLDPRVRRPSQPQGRRPALRGGVRRGRPGGPSGGDHVRATDAD